jgi:ABC-type transport system involved in multi-copper enzyme maturation permease subunit
MNQYIHADMKRIHSYPLHWFWLIAVYAIIGGIAFYQGSHGTAESYLETANMVAGSLCILLGIIIFISVFAADMRTRTMQAAIGSGVSRREVIYAKDTEGMILILVYYGIAGLILTLAPMLFHLQIAIDAIWMTTLKSMLETMVYFDISMILICATLRTNYAEILYILFAFQIVDGLLSLGLGYLASNFSFPDLTGFLFSSLAASFFKDPALNILSLAGIVLYLIIPVEIAQSVFKKKELEF